MRLILIAFLLLPSVAFADYEATARQCRAACAKIADEAKRVECTRKCPPLGVADADEVACKPSCNCASERCRESEPCCPAPPPPPPPKPTVPEDRTDATKPHPVDPTQH